MKKLIFLLLIILISISSVAAEKDKDMGKRKKVVVLATGGTIAGSGQAGKDTGYKSGVISAESLIASVPALAEVADIQTIQICNLNSDDITDKIWIELANTINHLAGDEGVTGFVVTHGTDTLEETAYFLNLTVKTEKCVVVTGAMRPATAASPDGPANLLLAVEAAASPSNYGKGVKVAFAGQLIPARAVVKRHTAALDAITQDKDALEPARLHTTGTEFDVSGLKGEASDVLARAGTLVDSLNVVAARLANGEGTLGRLAADDTLYKEIEGLVRDLRQVLDNYRDTTPISTFTSIATGAL